MDGRRTEGGVERSSRLKRLAIRTELRLVMSIPSIKYGIIRSTYEYGVRMMKDRPASRLYTTNQHLITTQSPPPALQALIP